MKCVASDKTDELVAQANDNLRGLITYFANADTCYRAVPKPRLQPRFDDYAHCASGGMGPDGGRFMTVHALRQTPHDIAPQELQRAASNPLASVWVGASAGSGKTTILTHRVTRLLLAGVQPEKILCLTFTRAGAAEMANRLTATFSRWATCDDKGSG